MSTCAVAAGAEQGAAKFGVGERHARLPRDDLELAQVLVGGPHAGAAKHELVLVGLPQGDDIPPAAGTEGTDRLSQPRGPLVRAGERGRQIALGSRIPARPRSRSGRRLARGDVGDPDILMGW